MDKKREAKLREQGWVQVGDDLLSPDLIELLRARAATPTDTDMTWDEMVAQVESEEIEGRSQE